MSMDRDVSCCKRCEPNYWKALYKSHHASAAADGGSTISEATVSAMIPSSSPVSRLSSLRPPPMLYGSLGLANYSGGGTGIDPATAETQGLDSGSIAQEALQGEGGGRGAGRTPISKRRETHRSSSRKAEGTRKSASTRRAQQLGGGGCHSSSRDLVATPVRQSRGSHKVMSHSAPRAPAASWLQEQLMEDIDKLEWYSRHQHHNAFGLDDHQELPLMECSDFFNDARQVEVGWGPCVSHQRVHQALWNQSYLGIRFPSSWDQQPSQATCSGPLAEASRPSSMLHPVSEQDGSHPGPPNPTNWKLHACDGAASTAGAKVNLERRLEGTTGGLCGLLWD